MGSFVFRSLLLEYIFGRISRFEGEKGRRGEEDRRNHNQYVFYIRDCPIFMEKVSALF